MKFLTFSMTPLQCYTYSVQFKVHTKIEEYNDRKERDWEKRRQRERVRYEERDRVEVRKVRKGDKEREREW